MTGISRRSLGRTGIEVSELGLGTWPLGGPGPNGNYGDITEQQAMAVLDTYVDAGANFIDTARVYNQSESHIGKYLKRSGNRDQLILASKTLGGAKAETLPKMELDLETSLRELGTDYLDIYFLHFPPDDPDLMEQALEKMVSFKQDGKIRAIGASIRGPNVTAATQAMCDTYAATGHIDCFMLVYSIFRQMNLSAIEHAEKNGIGIIARTVLESGLLTGAYSRGHVFPEGDHRARYDREKLDFIIKTAEEISGFAVNAPYTTLAQVAMRFSLSTPGVSTIVMGAQNPDEVRWNLDSLSLPPLTPELVHDLRSRYEGITERSNFN